MRTYRIEWKLEEELTCDRCPASYVEDCETYLQWMCEADPENPRRIEVVDNERPTWCPAREL
jgi:hypothetical protein